MNEFLYLNLQKVLEHALIFLRKYRPETTVIVPIWRQKQIRLIVRSNMLAVLTEHYRSAGTPGQVSPHRIFRIEGGRGILFLIISQTIFLSDRYDY